MEIRQFDLLAQELGGSGVSRRRAARTLAWALLGGAFAGLATRLGLVEDATAKSQSKSKPRKRRDHHTHETARAAGKHSKKHAKHNNHHKKPKDRGKPDDFALCSLTCETNGGRCCPGGVCIDAASCCDTSLACPDGSCPEPGECCPGEWLCPGNICHPIDECCPGSKPCGPTSCVPEDQCCNGEKKCGDICVPTDVCCPEDPRPNCSYPEEQEHCCHGERVCRHQFDTPTCAPYGDWLVYNSETCTCECPPGSVRVYPDQPWCCPSDHPHYDLGAVCLRDVDNRSDFVCPLGTNVCGIYNHVCCWSPD